MYANESYGKYLKPGPFYRSIHNSFLYVESYHSEATCQDCWMDRPSDSHVGAADRFDTPEDKFSEQIERIADSPPRTPHERQVCLRHKLSPSCSFSDFAYAARLISGICAFTPNSWHQFWTGRGWSGRTLQSYSDLSHIHESCDLPLGWFYNTGRNVIRRQANLPEPLIRARDPLRGRGEPMRTRPGARSLPALLHNGHQQPGGGRRGPKGDHGRRHPVFPWGRNIPWQCQKRNCAAGGVKHSANRDPAFA